jgi:hypothetical protein
MNSKFMLQLLSLVVLISCSTSEHGFIVLDVDKATTMPQRLNVSAIANSVEYICLETSDKCLINEDAIVHVGLVNNNFLIADPNGCYLFEPNGKFIQQVGRKGEGPGEHASIGNVFYDDHSEQIFISSAYSYADGILVFDAHGNYKKTMLSNTRIPKWTMVQDSVIVLNIANYMGNAENKAAFLSPTGDTLSTIANDDYFQLTGSPLSLNDNAIFYHYNKECYYMRTFNDTIYRITHQRELAPKYVVASVNHKTSNELRTDGGKFATTDFDFIIPWTIIETDRFLFINMFRNRKGLIPYFYYKKNKEFHSIAQSSQSGLYGFVDDLSGNNMLTLFPQYQLKNNLVCMVLSPNKILELKEKSPDLMNFEPCYLNEESNPVLSIIEIL